MLDEAALELQKTLRRNGSCTTCRCTCSADLMLGLNWLVVPLMMDVCQALWGVHVSKGEA